MKSWTKQQRYHVDELGVDDRRTWQHVTRVVELLNGWNKSTEALAFLTRAKDFVLARRTRENTSQRKGITRAEGLTVERSTTPWVSLLDGTRNSTDDPKISQMDIGPEMVRAQTSSNNQATQAFLMDIVKQCGQDNEKYAKQRLKAWTELIELSAEMDGEWDSLGSVFDADDTFHATLDEYPWDKEKFKSYETMEALLELAAAFLRVGRDDQAYRQFRKATTKAEQVYGSDDERTIWILISVGLVYQTTKGWPHAEVWFEQALAAALTKYGDEDGITQSLEAAKENRHFTCLNDEGRHYKSVFGVTGIIVRPGRLHIE
jgi:tetratricopeptide (TPR) repeat protein